MVKPRQAVALKWNPTKQLAPNVSASGSGAVADEILRLAEQHGIPIQHNSDLLQVLSLLDVGESIPIEIHNAIAEILAFIYWSNQQYEEIFNDQAN
ncbi:MAG: EscU/YscU/HrcU family type III secretion system export apparatus switch protein [Mariprofundaceae bacterium]